MAKGNFSINAGEIIGFLEGFYFLWFGVFDQKKTGFLVEHYFGNGNVLAPWGITVIFGSSFPHMSYAIASASSMVAAG